MTERRREKVHPESLLRIPLVRAAFSDGPLRPRPRAIDLRWHYRGIVERSLTGFVPLRPLVFYGARSLTADWLRAPERSARELNVGDHLVAEVLFCVHDHLHAWALATIEAMLGTRFVAKPGRRARELDDLAFVHLATEAAATVGLDYWYLATLEPHEICDVGTTRVPLTTPFHERYMPEYRRFRKDLVVQDPAFFVEMAQFYCDGRFVGFGADDIARSPRLARWLKHEVTYGRRQREYIREWLAFITEAPNDVDGVDGLGGPVRHDGEWHLAVLRDLGDSLWHYVKSGNTAPVPRVALSPESAAPRRFDARFVNTATMSVDEVLEAGRRLTDATKLRLLCDQFISTFDFDEFDDRYLPALLRAREARDLLAVHSLLQDCARLPLTATEPAALFLLG